MKDVKKWNNEERRKTNLKESNHKRISTDDIGKLLAITGIIFGTWIRLIPPILADFPINDGGLFYVMLESLTKNGFHLPEYISYNGLSIPFAYPPLAFYVGGLISRIFQIPLIDLVQWMPGIVTSIILIAFYDLARVILKSEFEAGVATVIFAFTPRALTWFVMGGGLTRSLGGLFLIMTIRYVYSFFADGGRKLLVPAILFGSLVVLTHPEASVHTIIGCLLIWALYGRSKQGTIQALSIGAGVFALTSFWWVAMLSRYGLDPFMSAMHTGDQTPLVLVSNLFIAVTEEPYLTTLAVLGFLGLTIKLFQQDFFLPAFYLLPLVAEPRNAANVVIIPLALLAAIAINQMILKTIIDIDELKDTASNHIRKIVAALLLLAFFLSILINVGYFSIQLSKNHLNTSTIDAFAWVKNNTEPNSTFIILTGDPDSFCDSVQEWFPVFTERPSLTTPQGKEWIAGDTFGVHRDSLTDLQNCMNKGISCVENVIKQMDLEFDYLFIQKTAMSKLFCVPRGETFRGGNLIQSIGTGTSRYTKVYSSSEVEIYAVME